MNTPHPATVPIAPALADLAFASASDSQVSRSLAWSSPGDLGIDLNDPAQRRFGDYELLELIGQGGMGAVYRARQHNLDREVALKFLAAGPWASDEFIARFRREAQAAARMQHPNIVEIYDTGVRDGLYFFSMRLVKGETLSDRVNSKGPMAVKQAAAMMRTIAEAIDYAHRLGVLHLDLKPGNVLLGEHDDPLVADFGLARRIDDGPQADHENVSGTPSYMAPEQATAKSTGIGPAADIYGLGAILYEMLVGEPPFRGRDVKDTLQHVLHDEPVAPKSRRHDIPADLDAICLKCLAKDPAQRYASARELADELGRFIEDRHVTARTPSLWERVKRWTQNNQAQTAMWTVLLVGIWSTLQQANRAEEALVVAQQHAERSEQMVNLLAQAFPTPEDGSEGTDVESSQVRVIRQLVATYGDDQTQQIEVLLKLYDALERADNLEAAQSLLQPVVEITGNAYRKQVAETLIAKADPEQQMLGALLLSGPGASEADDARQQQLLAQAVEAAPTSIDVLAAAVYFCSGKSSPCSQKMPARRLAMAQPDNAANWIAAVAEEGDPKVQRELMQRGTRAEHYDDHFNRVWGLGYRALRSAGVSLPPLLQSVARRLSSEADPIDQVAYFQTLWFPIPAWGSWSNFCKHATANGDDPAVREACLALAMRSVRESQSIIGSMIGVLIVRRLAPGTPAAREAWKARQRYDYVSEMLDRRTPAQVRASRDDLIGQELLSYGELEAWKRRLDRAGIPSEPQDSWRGNNPADLLTSDEREIYRRRSEQLAESLMFPERVESL